MEFKFCPECGAALTLKEIGDEGLIPYCSTCTKPYFKFSHACVLVAVINEYNEVALIRQEYVSKNNWVLVAGFIKQGETAEECTIREVEEETGLNVNSCKYISSYYYSQRDLLMFGFTAYVNKSHFGSSKEVDEINWFSYNDADTLIRPGSIAQQHFKAVMKMVISV